MTWQHREREIIEALTRGDRRPLGELIDHHGEDLMRYLTTILGRRELAEDAFQDTWVRVMERINRFDRRREFAPWLFRIARNRAYDGLRKRRLRRAFLLDPDRLVGELRPATGFEDRIVARRTAVTLLADLKPIYREAVWLRFCFEWSYERIARHCQVPIGTVKSRVHRGLDRLADSYRGSGEFENA